MKKLLLFTLLFTALNVFAEDGDVETIRVHDAVDMTWYGAYDEIGTFPDGSKTYEKILLHYTMGCASTGCSDWDYTTRIELRIPTGLMDSTVAEIDTISTNPLVVDTTWNVFPTYHPYELGRVITPYGGYMANNSNGFSNDWTHTHTFDITDFAMFMQDDVIIRAFYEGWSSGFSATLDFEFVEGTPPRKVHSIQNLYTGGSGYQTSQQFEEDYLIQHDIFLGNNVSSAKVRTIITGHGFDNNTSCAEFCVRNYDLKINGTERFTQQIWRDDCGMNPIWPQGGTWIFDRANWCPGERAHTFEHEITPYFNPGIPFSIDMDMQSYTWTGTQAPSYGLNCQLIAYETDLAEIDLALANIIAPTDEDEWARHNPINREPIIEIENRGRTPIERTLIRYGVINADGEEWSCYYEWIGNLETFEKERITLPYSVQWGELDPNNPTFFAEVLEMNYYFDNLNKNNYKQSTFTIPPRRDEPMEFRLNTNNVPTETSFVLTNEWGIAEFENPVSMQANTTYEYDMSDLAEGHYRLTVSDSDGDGLNNFAIPDGNGFVRIEDPVNGGWVQSWPADFGSRIQYDFTVGYTFGERQEPGAFCIDISDPSLVDTLEQVGSAVTNIHPIDNVKLGPNPSNGFINIYLPKAIKSVINIYDVSGKIMDTWELTDKQSTIDLPYPNGIYYLHLTHQGKAKSFNVSLIK